MPRFSDLTNLTEQRLKETKSLLKDGHVDGCFYMLGYVVEYALKAHICKKLNWDEYPIDNKLKNFITHDFVDLLKLSGLYNEFEMERKNNLRLDLNWLTISKWRPDSRYLPVGSKKEQEVIDSINAVEDPIDGILTWIKSK